MIDPADDLHHHGDEEPCGADERAGPSRAAALGHREGDGSAIVGTVVTAAAENSLPATPIEPFPEPAW